MIKVAFQNATAASCAGSSTSGAESGLRISAGSGGALPSRKRKISTSAFGQIVELKLPSPREGHSAATVLLKGVCMSRRRVLFEFSTKSLAWMSEYVAHGCSKQKPKRRLERNVSLNESP